MKRKWMKINKAVEFLEHIDGFSTPVFECNICNRYIRHPYDSPHHESPVFDKNIIGGGFREKEQCPICYGNDRLRFTVEVLRSFTNILHKPCHVLEIAPIRGMKKFLLKNNRCEYLSWDIISGRADRVMDITNIKDEEDTFDYIICCHVLEHIPDEKSALLGLQRILKPDGELLLSMPIDISSNNTLEDSNVKTPEERLLKYGQKDHVRLYGLDVKERLEGYGFNVREIIARKDMPELVSRYKLITDDRNFLCRRK